MYSYSVEKVYMQEHNTHIIFITHYISLVLSNAVVIILQLYLELSIRNKKCIALDYLFNYILYRFIS